VGSASVGTRERVVVLELGDRWLVVGVAPGHVSAIANLEKGVATNDDKADSVKVNADAQASTAGTLALSFGKILKNSASKFTEKTNG
jgi:flagellar protein FliO/FliZ